MSVRMAPSLDGCDRGVRVGILLATFGSGTLDVSLEIYEDGDERMWPMGCADRRKSPQISIFYLISGALSSDIRCLSSDLRNAGPLP
jgi:hypothetical protein